MPRRVCGLYYCSSIAQLIQALARHDCQHTFRSRQRLACDNEPHGSEDNQPTLPFLGRCRLGTISTSAARVQQIALGSKSWRLSANRNNTGGQMYTQAPFKRIVEAKRRKRNALASLAWEDPGVLGRAGIYHPITGFGCRSATTEPGQPKAHGLAANQSLTS